MREGDWVRMAGGAVLGRISEVIATRELALSKQLEGSGVIVDAQAKGFVFLSEECLAEEHLQLVRRGPSERFRGTLAGLLGLGVLLLLPALYSLASALHSAFTTGHVLVISLGRYETARAFVTWQAGWARFAGPIILAVSLLAFDGSRGVTLRWWLAGAGAFCSLILLAFSLWFTSIGGSLGFAGLLAFAATATVIGNRLGRPAAYLFIVACAGFLLWRVARAI